MTKSREASCNHPVPSRIPLTSGKGFHCESCGENIHVVPIGSEPKANRQTEQKSVSPKPEKALRATVKSIGLNADQKERANKDEAKQRKEWLRTVESNAKRLIKNIEEAKALVEQANVLHRKFKDTVKESLPLLENVRYGFAHLRKGETIMEETTGNAWSLRYLNVTYDYLCRVINKLNGKTSLLLTDGTRVIAPAPETEAVETAIDLPEVPEAEADEKSGQQKEEEPQAPVRPALKRKDGTVIPPAVYGPADAIRDIKTFMESAMKHMSPMDKGIVYRSLVQEIEDRLDSAGIVKQTTVEVTIEAEGVPAN
jgi:hypothetical protein